MNKKFRYIKIKDEQPKKRKRRDKEKVKRTVGGILTVIGTTISSMLLVLVIMMCIVVTVITVYILDFKDSSVEIDLKETDMKYTSIVYAYNADGQEVELKRLVKEENRIWIDYEDISPNLINAVIAKEDKRFWDHKGVDWRRTVAALLYDVLGSDKKQGGSTVTQQLIKNITVDNDRTWERKLREIFRALDLEEKYNKEEILESYLNRIAFGGMNYGIGAASEAYFGKTAGELDVAEAAIIAGIIKSPDVYNPYSSLEKCKDQQLWVLNEMYKQGYITTAEYEAAKVEQVKFKKVVYGDYFGYTDPRSIAEEEPDDEASQTPEEDETYEAYKWNGTYQVSQNWYTDAAINQVVSDYAELKGITLTSARNEIYNGGYRIYTNMDIEKQAIIEEKFRDPLLIVTKYDKSTEEKDLLQAAMVVMDYSGTVVALAGGVGDKPGDNCFNRATMAQRSPGSTMKPIGPYSTGIQENIIYYSMMIPDYGIKVYGNDKLWPTNYGQVVGDGTLRTAWYAVRESLNTVAVRVTRSLTPQLVYNQLTQNLGISTLTSSDINLAPLSLGALTEGVELLELTAAYQIFGSGGIYYEPKLYSRVVDSKGNVILEQNFYGTQAVDSDTAWITNRMMRKVVTSVANSAYYANINNVEVVGKTGTSNSGYDLLFAGCTPNYVGVVWQGNDLNKDMNSIPYKRRSAQVWHDVMAEFEDTSQPIAFTPDPTTIERKYCTETGLLASSSCTSTDIGYYRASNIPSYCSGNHEEEIQKIKDEWNAIDEQFDSLIPEVAN